MCSKMYFVFLTFQQVYRTRLFAGIFRILLSAARHYDYLELLDSVQSNMVLEIYGNQWRTRGKLRVVEAPSLQVCEINKRLIKWIFNDCLYLTGWRVKPTCIIKQCLLVWQCT
jgi:hypothetical protein